MMKTTEEYTLSIYNVSHSFMWLFFELSCLWCNIPAVSLHPPPPLPPCVPQSPRKPQPLLQRSAPSTVCCRSQYSKMDAATIKKKKSIILRTLLDIKTIMSS